jgi:Abortive infection alpha
MSDRESLLPAILAASDAEAIKAVSELGSSVIGVVKDAGQVISAVVGEAPKNAFGVLADQLAAARAIGAIRLQKKVDDERKRLGIENPQPASPSIAQPLLEAALNETREELQDVWAGLIVTATDPKRAHLVRKSFIDTLKQFDPYDALVLQTRANLGETVAGNQLTVIGDMLKLSAEDVQLSVEHLRDLKCIFISSSMASFIVPAYGKALLRACGKI